MKAGIRLPPGELPTTVLILSHGSVISTTMDRILEDRDMSSEWMEDFQRWQQEEATQYEWLTELLQLAVSAPKLQAAVAGLLLAFIFILLTLIALVAEVRDKGVAHGRVGITAEADMYQIARETFKELETERMTSDIRSATLETKEREEEAAESSDVAAETEPHPTSSIQDLEQLERARLFSEQMQEKLQLQHAAFTDDMKRFRNQGNVVFWGFMFTALLTLIFVVVGIVLIYRGSIAIGIVAEAIGLFPASGTLILNRLNKHLASERGNLSEALDKSLRTLQAIETAQLIPDPEKRSESLLAVQRALLTPDPAQRS